ncbi:MAG: HAD family phosphatase [Gemmatimonadetes bacterium]|nr:HAD family phosphatase [Gemmatimonadota bacterium]
MNYMPKNIKAVLFDMDGTLWNTEQVSEQVISQLLAEWGLASADLDLLAFHGIKWSIIGQLLADQFPTLKGTDPAAAIEARFEQILLACPAPLIEGAADAFRAAAQALPRTTAIVTGSDASTVEAFLEFSGLRPQCATYTSADMYQQSKPHPESYLTTAQRLGVSADRCLVFEDSAAGMRAALAAGMHCIAITAGQERRVEAGNALAHAIIEDFTHLPSDFFTGIVG